MMKRILNISFWVLILSGIVVLLGFADRKQGEEHCSKLNIIVDNGNGHFFIEESDIMNFLRETGDTLEGKPLRDINIGLLEKLLNNNP